MPHVKEAMGDMYSAERFPRYLGSGCENQNFEFGVGGGMSMTMENTKLFRVEGLV